MAYFERFVTSVSKGMDKVAQLALVAMMLLVCGNILLREVWLPILGTYEFVTFLGAVVVGFAIAQCAVRKGHVAVEVLFERFPKRTQVIIEIITVSISIVMMAIVAWQCAVYATQMWQSGQVSPTVGAPYYPFVYGVSLGFVMLTLVLIVDLYKLAAGGKRE